MFVLCIFDFNFFLKLRCVNFSINEYCIVLYSVLYGITFYIWKLSFLAASVLNKIMCLLSSSECMFNLLNSNLPSVI